MSAQRFTIAGGFVALGVFAAMWFYDYDPAQCAVAALATLAVGWWVNASWPLTKEFWSIASGAILAAAVFLLMDRAGMPRNQSWTGAVTALCAWWWVFESLPLAVTALFPAALFPLTGVLTPAQVASSYGDPYILLFFGGFVLSAAAEYWGAHRRLAQMTVAWVGGSSGRSVVFGIMLATTLVSMWIGNTAVALMMLPVAVAVLEQDRSGKLAVPLLLGVAYCASIGGIATPVGTAPNGVFMSIFQRTTGDTVPFHEWMVLATPVSLMMLVAAWLLLTWRLGDVGAISFTTKEKWTTPQKRTLAVFGLVCVGWITREIPYGGWQAWLNIPSSHDMTVALAGAVALFLIPSGDKERGGQLLSWDVAVRIPWGVLILFAGGIAIASAFTTSGLSEVIGSKFERLHDLPPLAILATLCFSVTFLSEFTSNTATANILMPILASMAIANNMEPAMLMVPATLSNSLAFMMPVGTPPNAIVYGTGHVRMRDMVRAGFVLNIVGAVIVTLYCWLMLPRIFGPTAAG
jgi:sodium-dependent dicarboxylate transporter 2/3/5